MEPATAAPFPSSRSRRSVPNLEKLNIAPLSSNSALEPALFSPVDPGTATPHASYIQGKSAPTTPGILSLSRSSSRNRQRRHRGPHSFVHDSYFPSSTTTPASPTDNDEFAASITKARSASALLSPVLPSRIRSNKLHKIRLTPADHPRKPGKKVAVSTEWLHRAGLAIASETRDQKGQTWLASRASSTSLVPLSPETYSSPLNTSHSFVLLPNDALDNLNTPRWPHPSSRIASRHAPRAASAHASRRGSKIDMQPFHTNGSSAGALTPTDSHPGPDFVDIFDEENISEGGNSDADEVVARLTHERSLGLGGWMDRLVGWTLFRVSEDGEDDTESEAEQELDEQEQARRKAELEALRKRQREVINTASARVAREKVEKTDEAVPAEEGEGGWQDAAWLLSVASRVLL